MSIALKSIPKKNTNRVSFDSNSLECRRAPKIYSEAKVQTFAHNIVTAKNLEAELRSKFPDSQLRNIASPYPWADNDHN